MKLFEMATEASQSTIVEIKKENHNDEIKDFAETAMNELLGWYGYDGVDKLDLSKTPCLGTPFNLKNDNNMIDIKNREDRLENNVTISVYNSSRENSKSPYSLRKTQGSSCGWCRREVSKNSPNFLTTPDGPKYCSESCFTQSRRASFKRAKTCDWCRHTRHAVSYVDFQDGASQLQFCSDKCLNQYKMQIFCRETQAHLDMNPHLKEKGLESSSSGGLITPDLWLKNCRSRSVSPVSELSRSPSPPPPPPPPLPSTQQPPSSKQQQNSTPALFQQQSTVVVKPNISVAPVSKLMPKNSNVLNNNIICQLPKHTRKKKSTRLTTVQTNRNNNNNTSTSQDFCLTNTKKNFNSTKLRNFGTAIKSANPNVNTRIPSDSNNFTNNFEEFNVASSSSTDMTQSASDSPPVLQRGRDFQQKTSNCHTRLPFSPVNYYQSSFGTLPAHQSIPPSIANQTGNEIHHPVLPGAHLPPVTVMIPYPIIVPLPIPIPIPLPVLNFLKATKQQKNEEVTVEDTNNLVTKSNSRESETGENVQNSNEPLDFTTSKSLLESEAKTTPVEAATIPPPITEKNQNDSTNVEQQNLLDSNNSDNETYDVDHKSSLKLKITRSYSKRLIAKEYEKSRPLRKRKRIIDYLKTSKDDEHTNQFLKK